MVVGPVHPLFTLHRQFYVAIVFYLVVVDVCSRSIDRLIRGVEIDTVTHSEFCSYFARCDNNQTCLLELVESLVMTIRSPIRRWFLTTAVIQLVAPISEPQLNHNSLKSKSKI